MSPDEFARLVKNVKTDGRLTSLPLACANDDGSVEILSGHHRTLAAIEAGLEEIDVIVITTPLTEERKAAIQLSHNAVTGQDNPTVLADMYRQLGLDAKMFSGLTDAVLDLDKLTIGGFNAAVLYEELRVAFLPDDRQQFEAAVKKIKSAKTIFSTHVARYEDFDAIFDVLIAIKAERGVMNSALALLVMAELALERLAQIEAENDKGDTET